MALNRQLSLYWGNNTLYFTEISASKPVNAFSVPFDLQKSAQPNENKFISTSMEIVSAIESQLKAHKISTTTLNLSLPIKDIIFRSFVIPWMNANEIRGVVSFEISKYIPFSLEELKYSYHPITVTINNVKKIKIIFVAVRIDTLENYTNILESAGLQLKTIEPSSQSIVRTLLSQKLLDKSKTTAIIEKGEHAGKITIVDQGIPQFVREFQLRVGTKDKAHDNTDLASRLINEIRISIDYFTRQDNLNPVSEIKILDIDNSDDLAKSLSTELNIPTSPIFLQNIFQLPQMNNIAYLNAFGIGIFNTINMECNLDLSQKSTPIKSKQIVKESVNFSANNSIISTLLICVGVAALTFFIASNIVNQPRKKVAKLEAELGLNKDVTIDKIEEDTANLINSLEYFKSLRHKSSIAYYLTTIPTMLPEGVWIKTFDINYPDSTLIQESKAAVKKGADKKGASKKLTETKTPAKETKNAPSTPRILLSGYAYTDNIREQFKLVNQLLKNIRDNKDLTTLFSQISLDAVKAEKKDDITVTYYEIKCK